MSREILFRGKRKCDGKWVYGYYVVRGLVQHAIYTPGRFAENDGYEVDPATVGQYTGLTDKNGVKIFEGDVVDPFGVKGVVTQECGTFGIRFSRAVDRALLESKITHNNDQFFSCNDDFILLKVEVIGNIHDNPELLEGDGHG